MPISRRAFLGNVGKLAATQALPSSFLGIPLDLSAALSELPGVVLSADAVLGGINSSWSGFASRFNWYTEFPDHKLGSSLNETVTERLDQTLPPLFTAVAQFRKLRSHILSGNIQQDDKTIDILRVVTDLKKNFYLQELKRLADLCPDDHPWLKQGLINPYWGDPEKSEQWIDENFEKREQYEHAKWCVDLRGRVGHYGCLSAHQLKVEYSDFLDSATDLQLIDPVFEAETIRKRSGMMGAIQKICKSVGLSEKLVHDLTDLHAAFAIDSLDWLYQEEKSLQESYEGAELFEWLGDERKLFQRIAFMIEEQANLTVAGLTHKHELELSADSIDYITTQLEGVIQQRYRTHFAAALPDVLDIPLPQLSEPLDQLLALRQVRLAEASEVQPELSENASADALASGTEAEINSARIPSSLRLLATNAARQTEEILPAANGDAAPAIDLSAATLMENAGIATPRSGANGQAAPQAPSP